MILFVFGFLTQSQVYFILATIISFAHFPLRCWSSWINLKSLAFELKI